MKNEKINLGKKTQALLESLHTEFVQGTRAAAVSNASSAVIAFPLILYDGRRLELSCEEANKEFVLHDGGRIRNYLSDYGISVESLTEKTGAYHHFFSGVQRKFGVRYNRVSASFYVHLAKFEGERALLFAHGMVRISFLVMLNGAGINRITA